MLAPFEAQYNPVWNDTSPLKGTSIPTPTFWLNNGEESPASFPIQVLIPSPSSILQVTFVCAAIVKATNKPATMHAIFFISSNNR